MYDENSDVNPIIDNTNVLDLSETIDNAPRDTNIDKTPAKKENF